MKKLLVFSMLCMMALCASAQSVATQEGLPENAPSIAVMRVAVYPDVPKEFSDTCKTIFYNEFRPSGYRYIDQAQIRHALAERGLKRSQMNKGELLEASKTIGLTKMVYLEIRRSSIYAELIDVQTKVVELTESANIESSQAMAMCRATTQSVAQKLSAKLEKLMPRNRDSVVTIEKLKVFPNELGMYTSEPKELIARINQEARYGYNNWRLPSYVEMKTLKSNHVVTGNDYMTKENKYGIVLLVTDGPDYATVHAENQAKQADEQASMAELERHAAQLKAQGYVDLGLPSGTFWKDRNEEGEFYTYGEAINKFGDNLPKSEQFRELIKSCRWLRTRSGYKVIGPNGNSIELTASGNGSYLNSDLYKKGIVGYYWTSTFKGAGNANFLYFDTNLSKLNVYYEKIGFSKYSVRLVQDSPTIHAEKQAKQREEEALRAEQKRHTEQLKAMGWVDLDLPSGILWKAVNELSIFYTYKQAVKTFGSSLPTEEQFEELKKNCSWSWNGSGYTVTGSNGNSIVLPALGYRDNYGDLNLRGEYGFYWSTWLCGSDCARSLSFYKDNVYMSGVDPSYGLSVRLVHDYATIQAEEQARQRREQERREYEKRHAEELKKQWVDLGLPSGTLWKDRNEEGGFYRYDQAVKKFGNNLPTAAQFEELINECSWTWNGKGYQVTGPNGNSIVLPALGYCSPGCTASNVGSIGRYWSSSPSDHALRALCLGFNSDGGQQHSIDRLCSLSVRLVQNQ